MSATVEGALRIELSVHHGAISDVRITSSRPLYASRIFHGMRPADALTLIPRLFSICGTAQGCAAALALESAQGIEANNSDLTGRRLATLMESAQEYGWRIAIDGARLASRSPQMQSAAQLRSLLPRLSRALFPHGGWSGDKGFETSEATQVIDALDGWLAEHLYGSTPAQWSARIGETPFWWRNEQSLAADLLRALENAESFDFGNASPQFLASVDLSAIDAALTTSDGFIAAPAINGKPQETTPLARLWNDQALAPTIQQFGAGLATRFTALLLALARIPGEMRHLLDARPSLARDTISPAPRVGVAHVPAARGSLIHRVEMGGNGAIARYQILAPTEWNFHPHGVVTQSLRGKTVGDAKTAKKQTEWLVQAIDPCVGYEVVVHA